MSVAPRERLCPHCRTPNALDVSAKCVKCRKRLPACCFACYSPIDEDAKACAACGRGHWVVGDLTELPCAVESGTVRQHRYMTTLRKGGKVVHEWRCMKCLTDETRTDALAHFPERATATA